MTVPLIELTVGPPTIEIYPDPAESTLVLGSGVMVTPGVAAGLLYTWSTTTTDADPGAGKIRANNADLSAATQLFVSDTDGGSTDQSAFLLALDDVTNAEARALIVIADGATGDRVVFKVTGASTDATGYVKLSVTYSSGATSLTDINAVSFQTALSGVDGTNGADGADGVLSGTQIVYTDAANAIGASDSGKTLIANRATAISFDFAASTVLGTTFTAPIKNENSGALTLNPDGAETIDGAASLTLEQGESLVVHSDGSNLRTVLSGSGSNLTGTSLSLSYDGNGDSLASLDKQATGDDALVSYKTGGSLRAKAGLAGDDDYSLSVSPDGSTFYDAFQVDKSTGVITLPNGIAIGATGDILDTFDTGTFSPTIAFNNLSTGITYTQNDGNYAKIGDWVIAQMAIVLSSKGSATGIATVEGLPFTVATAGLYFPGTVICITGFSSLTVPIARTYPGTTMQLLNQNATNTTQLTDANFSNSSNMKITIFYLAA